jgi:hypothetical protein
MEAYGLKKWRKNCSYIAFNLRHSRWTLCIYITIILYTQLSHCLDDYAVCMWPTRVRKVSLLTAVQAYK